MRENVIVFENYIGKKRHNVTITWEEHSDIGKTLEPVKHLYQFSERSFNWEVLNRVPNKVRQRKIHEAY